MKTPATGWKSSGSVGTGPSLRAEGALVATGCLAGVPGSLLPGALSLQFHHSPSLGHHSFIAHGDLKVTVPAITNGGVTKSAVYVGRSDEWQE